MDQDKPPRDPKSLPVVICDGFSPIPRPSGIGQSYYAARGWKTFIVPYDGKAMRDTRMYAALIDQHVRGALIQCGVKQAHIVAHSMGGVAALYAIKRLDMADHVANFVGFGSPFHGTNVVKLLGAPLSELLKLANLAGFGTTLDQLLENSEFLKRLHADPLPAGPNHVSLAGSNDFIVTPKRTLLAGAYQETRAFGHESFLISHSLHRWMESFLI